MAVLHGDDDGRAAEGPIAGGEDLRIGGSHGVELGTDAVGRHHAESGKLVALSLLANRGDDHAAGDVVLAAGHDNGAAAAVGVGLAGLGLHATKRDGVALRHDRGLLGAVDELDAFLDGALELVTPRRNVFGSAAVDNGDRFTPPQPAGDAAGVHRDVAAAHDHHPRRHLRALAGIDAAQEADAVDDPLVFEAGDPERLAPPRTDRQEHRIVAGFEFAEAHPGPELGVEMDLDARAVFEHADGVFGDDPRRQPKGGNPPHHHAAQAIGGLIDVDRVARLGEILRGGKAGRAGADDGDGLGAGDRDRG